MKLKKIVSLATSVVLSTSLLVGCSGKNKGNGGNVSNEKATLKIGMITDVAGVNDQALIKVRGKVFKNLKKNWE